MERTKLTTFVTDNIKRYIYWLSQGYDTTKNQRIAHAGGMFDNYQYTNSFDALEKNKNDFEIFELDFSWTSDNQLVCIHDWEGSFYKAFGKKYPGSITLNTFRELVKNNKKFKNCDLYTLGLWLRKNPYKYIVTDIKSDNKKGVQKIVQDLPNRKGNFIVQIYDPVDYDFVKNLGFQKVILTLYKYGGTKQDLLHHIKGREYFAITIDQKKIQKGWGKTIKEHGFFTYTHTINQELQFQKLRKLGIDEIYTDSLFVQKY